MPAYNQLLTAAQLNELIFNMNREASKAWLDTLGDVECLQTAGPPRVNIEPAAAGARARRAIMLGGIA